MSPFLLLLVGGGVSLYCLWQFRRWLGQPQPGEAAAPGAQRLEVLIDELVATAEATSAVVQEKAEALTELISRADQRISALAGAPAVEAGPIAVTPVPAHEAARGPAPQLAAPAEPELPDMQREVYALADAGQDVTMIARRLGLTKGEVQLVLSLRR